MSICLGSVIEDLDRTAADVLHGYDGWNVASMTAEDAYDKGCDVRRDPLDPLAHPCNPAHGVVTLDGSASASKKVSRRLAKKMAFVVDLGPVGHDAGDVPGPGAAGRAGA